MGARTRKQLLMSLVFFRVVWNCTNLLLSPTLSKTRLVSSARIRRLDSVCHGARCGRVRCGAEVHRLRDALRRMEYASQSLATHQRVLHPATTTATTTNQVTCLLDAVTWQRRRRQRWRLDDADCVAHTTALVRLTLSSTGEDEATRATAVVAASSSCQRRPSSQPSRLLQMPHSTSRIRACSPWNHTALGPCVQCRLTCMA